jgi:hypothetical protein
VTITGAGFTGATAVDFGSSNPASYVINSDTTITATSPAGSGTVDVTVTTPDGTSATSSSDQFSYVAVVTGVSPAFGSASGGDQVTISGFGFTGVTAVDFGAGNAASNVTFHSDTSITATSPAGFGVVDVTVTTPDGTSATTSGDQFSYVPEVTQVSPLTGSTAGGDTVTISGLGFTGATIVDFGAGNAAIILTVTDTSITVTSPSGTGMVDVTVTTPTGTSPVNAAADQFTYS